MPLRKPSGRRERERGLELGAVDKLLVGILVEGGGEEGGEKTLLTHPRPSYLLLRCLANRN